MIGLEILRSAHAMPQPKAGRRARRNDTVRRAIARQVPGKRRKSQAKPLYTDGMNNTRFPISFGICASLLLLTACATSAQTPTSPATTAAPTATLRPSLTPSLTQTPRPTLTRTSAPTNAPEPSITPDIIATVVATSQPRIDSPLRSPDDKWQAEVVIYDCIPIDTLDLYGYEELRLVEIKTGAEKVIDAQLKNCGGLGAAGLEGLFWSPNSRYLYYTRAREGVPDGCGYLWERPITRLDIVNQTSEQLGGGPWSPDKTKMAAWQWPEKELVIWRMNGGEFTRVSALMPDANIGPIAWSPDGQSLVYLQAELDCYPFGKTYAVRFDLPSLKQKLLLESDKPSWGGVIWESPNQLNLFDENGKEWRYNLLTKKLEL
jgi:hypothetical protein